MFTYRAPMRQEMKRVRRSTTHAGTDLTWCANDDPFTGSYWARIEAMLEYLGSITDGAGNVPMVGDTDDGYLAGFAAALEAHLPVPAGRRGSVAGVLQFQGQGRAPWILKTLAVSRTV
jgi:hypothetical protein